ncbi:hypothetical protein [Peribacillus sp. SCS-155]|uniref:hypothetical protein n=1 Tax=Peribacillus sedimenti TaxID=3115297 RepID=UPI0039062D23
MPEHNPQNNGSNKSIDGGITRGRVGDSPNIANGLLEDRRAMTDAEFSQEIHSSAGDTGSPDSGANFDSRNF